VQNVLPGMQAAFVDIGLERNAFLYAGDIVMSDDPDDEIEQVPDSRNIRDILKPGQTIMVQVAKDPVGTKGARVTTHITLAGRTLVLMPTMDYVGVSRRIDKDEERQRLRKILAEIKPKGMGVIVRTASAGKPKDVFAEDMESIVKLYHEIDKKAAKRKAPALLHAEQSLLLRTVRDLLMKDIDRVFVNNQETYDEIREIADVMAPKLKARILLKESEALFDRYDTEGKIEKALSRKVWLKSGGYVIIDRTEALTSIDVNSGKFVGKDNLEKTITSVNCEAAKEIAKQLRLRDIGGIIIIDFIDMEGEHHREELFNFFREAVKKDKSRINILKLSEFGLVQMTRKRHSENLNQMMCEPCHYCGGEGVLKSRRTICYEIFRKISRTSGHTGGSTVTVRVHPRIADMLLKEEESTVNQLETDTGKRLIIAPAKELHIEKYEIIWQR
jgi:ribonuclease G